jgi:hypothetical protein
MEDPTTDLTGLLTTVQTLHGTLGQPATPGGAGTAPIAARFQVVLADAAAATARVNAQTTSVGSPRRAALRLRTLLAGMLARLGSARREVARLEAELATCVTAMRADGGPSAAGGAGSGGGVSPSGVTRAEAAYVHCFVVVRSTRMRLANRRCLFSRFLRSHSIHFTGAQGLPKCKIELGRGKDGWVGVHEHLVGTIIVVHYVGGNICRCVLVAFLYASHK